MKTVIAVVLTAVIVGGAAFFLMNNPKPQISSDVKESNPNYFLAELLECKSFDFNASEVANALDIMGANKLAHETDEFGDQSWTYEINPSIEVFGFPVSKIGMYQLSGDGGNASYGMSAFFDVDLASLARVADVVPDSEVDGYSKVLSDTATRVISSRDNVARSFCDVSVED